MATAHNITTKRDIVKVLQYATEGNTITTPANYGVTPVGSSWAAAGLNVEIDPQLDIRDIDVDILGSEDVVDAVKTEELFAFSCRFEMFDTVLPAYGINASGGGLGSIDASLTFLFSEYLDGTEYYTIMQGCRPTNTTVSLARGKWMCDMTFVAKEIDLQTTSHGLGTQTFVTSLPTSSPMTHSGAGPDPFTWNSTAFPENNFSCTVSRTMAIEALNGQNGIIYAKPVGRSINFNVDVFTKNVTLETDFRNKTLRAANYSVSTSPNKDLAFTNCVIKTWRKVRSATSIDGVKEVISCRAETVAI